MNPSGDFGKRELSPALRNRFTEIWCTSITSSESLSVLGGQHYLRSFILQMTRFGLGSLCSESVLTQISEAICDLFVWVNVTWSHVVKPLSIRDLKTIIELAQGMWPDVADSGIFAAIYLVIEGQLGVSRAQMERLRVWHSARQSLDQIITKHPILARGCSLLQNLDLEITAHALSINRISLPTHQPAHQQSADNTYILQNQKVLSNLLRITMGLKSQRAILLEGPPGVGKTSLILHLGKLLGKKVHRVNLNEQTDLLDLLGFDVPDPDRPGESNRAN